MRSQRPDLRHLAFGDLFLTDVRTYRERLLNQVGWTPGFRCGDGIRAGLRGSSSAKAFGPSLPAWIRLQLAPEFVGREFDEELLADFPESVDPCGERGEVPYLRV